NRKFLTKTARSQHQKVTYFYDIFKFATLESISTNGSQLVTSEVVTRNELRTKLGFRPSEEPNADKLMNPNINPQDPSMQPQQEGAPEGAENSGGPSLENMKVSDIP
ncbi:MAG: phage portal protein, partial [Lachnospiraceae bacterium]|nr:phage portal protein [Lachnospiraceae bacterium]